MEKKEENMFIESLVVSELGIFQNLELLFCKDKINIIRGSNGCGKTTILAVLYSMLQDNEILRYKCEGNKALVNLKFIDKDNRFSLNKYYQNNCSEIMVESFEEMKRILSVDRDRVYLLIGEFIGHKYKLSNGMINNVNQFLDEKGIENIYKIDISNSECKSYNIMSGGVQTYYWLVNLISNTPQDSVLMIDEPFAMLDYNTVNEVLNIMKKMKNIQFILTSNQSVAVNEEYNTIILEAEGDFTRRGERMDFDYQRIFHDNVKLPDLLQKESSPENNDKVIIKYELDKEIDEVEKRNVEFKEVKGNNPCNSIIDNGEIYINAFLNSKVSGIGIIKWGISNDGIVKGVKLSKEDRDAIDRKISERIGQMKPYVSTESVQISFEGVVCNNEIIRDLYIVEISVETAASDILFATSKNEVYIKTDGGKRKLDSYEIQQELKRRLKY
jgi:hypothetical protein